MILVIMLYKVVLTFEKKDHNNFKSKETLLSSSLRSFCSVPFGGGGVGKGRWFSLVRSFVSFVCDFMFILYPLCKKYLSKTVGCAFNLDFL